jgi:hypothetical protein
MTSVAAWLLTACGVALVLIGAFFLILRPPLLPEDARFMGSTAERIVGALPTLTKWLRRVFWVLGGYIATTGILVVYVANTGVRSGDPGAIALVALSGVTSVGWMSAVNFMIRSDFRWILLGLDGVWVIGVVIALLGR